MMRLVTASEAANVAPETQILLTLSESEVEQLCDTLPSLLRALADRPEAPPRQRARRERARAILERLLTVLSPHVDHAGAHLERQ